MNGYELLFGAASVPRSLPGAPTYGPSPLVAALQHLMILEAIEKVSYGASWQQVACDPDPFPHIVAAAS